MIVVADMAADMEVDKVADKVADMVADEKKEEKRGLQKEEGKRVPNLVHAKKGYPIW